MESKEALPAAAARATEAAEQQRARLTLGAEGEFEDEDYDEDALEDVLAGGAERARAIAAGVLADVRDAMGIGPPRA